MPSIERKRKQNVNREMTDLFKNTDERINLSTKFAKRISKLYILIISLRGRSTPQVHLKVEFL